MDLLVMFGIALLSIIVSTLTLCLAIGLIYLFVTIINYIKEKRNEH